MNGSELHSDCTRAYLHRIDTKPERIGRQTAVDNVDDKIAGQTVGKSHSKQSAEFCSPTIKRSFNPERKLIIKEDDSVLEQLLCCTVNCRIYLCIKIRVITHAYKPQNYQSVTFIIKVPYEKQIQNLLIN